MDSLKILNLSCIMLSIIGALNMGLTAILGTDVLAPILGGYDAIICKLIYLSIGLSGLWVFYAYIMTPNYSPGYKKPNLK